MKDAINIVAAAEDLHLDPVNRTGLERGVFTSRTFIDQAILDHFGKRVYVRNRRQEKGSVEWLAANWINGESAQTYARNMDILLGCE